MESSVHKASRGRRGERAHRVIGGGRVESGVHKFSRGRGGEKLVRGHTRLDISIVSYFKDKCKYASIKFCFSGNSRHHVEGAQTSFFMDRPMAR